MGTAYHTLQGLVLVFCVPSYDPQSCQAGPIRGMSQTLMVGHLVVHGQPHAIHHAPRAGEDKKTHLGNPKNATQKTQKKRKKTQKTQINATNLDLT